MKIKIINKSKHPLPKYQTALSAGMDLCANIEESIVLKSLERKLIPTGLFLELPEGYEAQVRPRSGLAIKNGITVLNSPGCGLPRRNWSYFSKFVSRRICDQ